MFIMLRAWENDNVCFIFLTYNINFILLLRFSGFVLKVKAILLPCEEKYYITVSLFIAVGFDRFDISIFVFNYF